MAEYAVMARNAGATIIGGCCGTTADHLRAMRASLEASVKGPAPDLADVAAKTGRVLLGERRDRRKRPDAGTAPPVAGDARAPDPAARGETMVAIGRGLLAICVGGRRGGLGVRVAPPARFSRSVPDLRGRDRGRAFARVRNRALPGGDGGERPDPPVRRSRLAPGRSRAPGSTPWETFACSSTTCFIAVLPPT